MKPDILNLLEPVSKMGEIGIRFIHPVLQIVVSLPPRILGIVAW